MGDIFDFIIIDDDKLNNKICHKIIENTCGKVEIASFLRAEDGLEYIAGKYSVCDPGCKAVILLDINMPEMDAWDFLDEFANATRQVKENVRICILSSSVDQGDMARARKNPLVEHYLIKPLSADAVRMVIDLLNIRYSPGAR